MKIINSICDIIDNYNLIILDIFGVIHNGSELYSNVTDTMSALNKAGKQIIFLSNAPRRAMTTQSRLEDFNLYKGQDYIDIVTSGEVAFHYFGKQNKVQKYFYIGPEKDRNIFEANPDMIEADAETADFAIATGLDPHEEVSNAQPFLDRAIKNNLLFYCINPDKLVHKAGGRSHVCAGAVADRYIEMGGKVEYFGKPYLNSYEYISATYNTPKDKILAVGDGITTDILGANNFGCDSLLIASGLLHTELGLKVGDELSKKHVVKTKELYNIPSTYIASLF
ncbi:MAG: TIGR01459 family HAD-type hydrolase [Rickettsiales bacterium]|jgi:HAD superfamily hydrolase (TIGR01459 family)|nr:TIGR01459 family HAD-type hydrolase [Rickettsiales bacterium]